MKAELNAIDRATLGVWRALHAWAWGSVAFIATITLHVALNSLVMVVPAGYANRPALPWQFGVRAAGTVGIGLLIGYIVAWRVEMRPWLTAIVVGALFTLVALGLIDRLFGLPTTSSVEVIREADGVMEVSVGTGSAGPVATTAYAVLTAATTIVAGVVAWRRRSR